MRRKPSLASRTPTTWPSRAWLTTSLSLWGAEYMFSAAEITTACRAGAPAAAAEGATIAPAHASAIKTARRRARSLVMLLTVAAMIPHSPRAVNARPIIRTHASRAAPHAPRPPLAPRVPHRARRVRRPSQPARGGGSGRPRRHRSGGAHPALRRGPGVGGARGGRDGGPPRRRPHLRGGGPARGGGGAGLGGGGGGHGPA